MNGPKIIVELLISPLEAIHIFLPTNEKNEKTISNYLRGWNFRWGIFKGARGGGSGVGRFKRGSDLKHNPNRTSERPSYLFSLTKCPAMISNIVIRVSMDPGMLFTCCTKFSL